MDAQQLLERADIATRTSRSISLWSAIDSLLSCASFDRRERKYGIDPVHFGLIFIIAATIGNYTPPVGGAMFVVCQVPRCPIGEYTRESMPFLFAVSAVTILLIFTPEIVLVVPNWLFGAY